MLRVALTGGIATGKSYVRTRVQERGVPTIDADAIVHALMEAGSPVAEAIAARFGAGYLRPDGAVDRPSLGRLVFSDASARAELEAIVHPQVYARIFAWAFEREAAGAAWVMADVPLLFETGREVAFDRVVVAVCAPDVQLQRVMRRDGLSEAAARARIDAQWPIAEKAAQATDLVDTGLTFAETDRQVAAVCAAIDAAAQRRR
jgi:dephospho-CoA kinase